MAAQWVGYTVAINCGSVLGTFKGVIAKVEASDQSITLRNADRNGVPCTSREITIRATDIKDLEILQKSFPQDQAQAPPPQPFQNGQVKSAFHAAAPHSSHDGMLRDLQALSLSPIRREIPIKLRPGSSGRCLFPDGFRSPSKKDRHFKQRDVAAFGSPIDNAVLEEDFDFEKNLALFNKQAEYEMINQQSSRPDLVKQAETPQKYRHDENVLEATPAKYRQIKVPGNISLEYVTDSGLVVPSISISLRNQLLGLSERLGVTIERQAELMGRAATEIALQLLGGGHRLNPRNAHQLPNVVVFCGSQRSAVLGANCARQLSSHGIPVQVVIPESGISSELYRELSMFRLTKNPVLTNMQCLTGKTADLIIVAIDDPQMDDFPNKPLPDWLPFAINWIKSSRAPVM
ncbi:enhancer of mRNA-decapping protein 3-like [Neocloeon triangulifer]|uniref:enhancer of mRNA-decapping protein 3-like n=1 Tax=Neocloeon triangulifer TaxID=2078957 RepID=UPI00286F3A6D|nr:enhancer of mRNA-decapping protein 3-like [Neocloeon triangulifer]